MQEVAQPPANGTMVPVKFGRDRRTLLSGGVLVAVAGLAWAVVLLQAVAGEAAPMVERPAGMDMPPIWVAQPAAFLTAWAVMMAAMMLPSATPMIVLYGGLARNFRKTGQSGIPTALFALVYFIAWLICGVPVYVASLGVDLAASAGPRVASLLPYGLVAVLLTAGLYEFSPLKRACLRVCRSPLAFLMGHWRSGYPGTSRLAAAHAAYCIGCCWGLMAILVAAGAMALPWVIFISLVVFAQKLLPGGELAARITGAALLVLALAVAVQPEFAVGLRGQGM